MIHYFVLFLILTAASSIGAFSLLQMNQSTQSLIKAQSERQNLDMWEYALINKLEALGSNQGLAAPLGVNDPADTNADGNPDIPHQLLPDGLGIKKTNAWGRPFVYCPHYPEAVDFSVTTQSIWTGSTEGDTNNYLTGVVTDHAGVDYVVQADQTLDISMAGRKVLAMIISPLPSSAGAPSCNQVTYNASLNSYSVPNGIVRVIEQSNAVAYLSGGRSVTVVDSDNYATQNLNTMLDKVSANKPDLIMLDLSSSASSYIFDNDYIFYDPTPGNNRSIVIEGNGKSSTVIDSSSPVTLTFDGVDVLIKNITLRDNVRLVVKNGELTTDNAELSRTTVLDSDWFIYNNVEIIDNGSSALTLEVANSSIRQGNAFLKVKGGSSKSSIAEIKNARWSIASGQVIVESTASSTTGISLKGNTSMVVSSGTVKFQRDGAATVKTARAFHIDSSSTLDLDSSDIINTYPANIVLSVNGELIFSNSSLSSTSSIDRAIVATVGGSVTLRDSSRIGLNTPPAQGVVDSGMRFALGSGSTIYAGVSCWSGPIFTDVPSQTSGSSEATTPDYEIFNQSIWACNP